MTGKTRVTEMYDRHPISAAQVLAKVTDLRGTLDGVTPPDLFDHDQDHYGGLAANVAIAVRAQLKPDQKVADFCAGLGGPARYLAHSINVHVTGIELNENRVAGAEELTSLVGLDGLVQVQQGDVTATGLDDAAFDAVVSQEAFLHVSDKGAAIEEAWRILKPGGRLVFTDWVLHELLDAEDADILWQGLAAQTLKSLHDYEVLLTRAGFAVESTEDLTQDWAHILEARFRMYQTLHAETSKAGLPEGEDMFYRAYVRLVDLVQAGRLGGGRFAARK